MFTKTLAALCLAASVDAKKWPDAHGDAYIGKSATEKMDQLWTQVKSDASEGSWLHLPGVLIEGMGESFDSPGDDMPCYWDGCRNKDIHSVGVISKVKLVSSGNHPFTGVFKGADQGLIRQSTAAPYSSGTKNLKPGMGLKFLRDGHDSANLVAMFSVDGQDSWNFFGNDWSNHIPVPQSKALAPLAIKFHTATDYIQAVGLSEMAQFDQAGNEESNVVFPFSLRFAPMPEFQWSDDYTEDPLEQLSGIPSGSTIWEVYGMDAPTEMGGKEHLIGSLVTSSETTKSNYSDDMMLFRHQRAEADIAAKPEWTEYYPKYQNPLTYEEGDCGIASGEPMKPSCPFAFLMW